MKVLLQRRRLSAVIAWWGSASSCHTQADEETDPAYRVNYNSCLLTAQYNRVAERLIFQNATDLGLSNYSEALGVYGSRGLAAT